MNIRSKLLFTVLAAGIAAAPAAATVTFTLSGDATAQFTLPSSPTPSVILSEGFVLLGQTGSYGGIAGAFDLYFYLDSNGGGFDLLDPSGNQGSLGAFGPQLFSGALATPTFLIGTFNLADNAGEAFYSLTIANTAVVPEPASWALLIAGFGLTGAAMRRRRRSSSETSRQPA